MTQLNPAGHCWLEEPGPLNRHTLASGLGEFCAYFLSSLLFSPFFSLRETLKAWKVDCSMNALGWESIDLRFGTWRKDQIGGRRVVSEDKFSNCFIFGVFLLHLGQETTYFLLLFCRFDRAASVFTLGKKHHNYTGRVKSIPSERLCWSHPLQYLSK